MDGGAREKTRFRKMTVIKLALLKHSKAKDGSYKIRIAIGHRSETHYIVTPYSVNSPSEFDGRAVVRLPNAAQMNIELTRMLLDYQQRLSRVRNPEQYTCTQLRTLLMQMQSQQADITFKKASDEFINELKRSQRTTYANMMQKTQEYFLDFCNGDIFLSTLTPQQVLDFSRYLMNRTLKKSIRTFSDTTINIHMTDLKVIINRAMKMQQVRYDIHPFLLWKKRATHNRELDITVEELRAIRDYPTTSYAQRYARDMFLLSYYLGGINLVDLLRYDFRDKTQMDFIRTKSRNTKQGDNRTSFTIQPEALPIINRYMDKQTGLLLFAGKKKKPVTIQGGINRNLKKMAQNIGVQDYKKVCWYTARKSFVQHGFDLGITLDVLEYCIGQSMKTNRPIFNYLRIMRKHADVAIRQIIDNLNDKQNDEQNDKSGDPHGKPDKPI